MDDEADKAPGPLDVMRHLVNTLDYPSGPDQLGSLEQASQWCGRHGLPPPSNQRELERFQSFREAVRRLMAANNGAEDAADAWDGMRPYLESARFALTLRQPQVPSLEPKGDGVERTIAILLAVLYDAVATGTWPRLRACRKGSCRFAYYDRSKNGSRAWCSMAVCGNREKAQRRRTRERHDAA